MIQIYSLNNIGNIKIPYKKQQIIFLYGDLGAGKTTLSKHILQNIYGVEAEIISPTYTYYNKYGNNYHFDLYRICHYDEFFSIGGEDILDNLEGVALIEWPEKIKKYYKSDIDIYISKTDQEQERKIEVIYNNE